MQRCPHHPRFLCPVPALPTEQADTEEGSGGRRNTAGPSGGPGWCCQDASVEHIQEGEWQFSRQTRVSRKSRACKNSTDCSRNHRPSSMDAAVFPRDESGCNRLPSALSSLSSNSAPWNCFRDPCPGSTGALGQSSDRTSVTLAGSEACKSQYCVIGNVYN